jgi:hypothetical protein
MPRADSCIRSTAPLAQARIVSEPIVGRTLAKTDAGDDHPILAVDSRHLGDHTEYTAPRGIMSDDWVGRSILVDRAEQIELHPCDIVPAVLFPFDAPVQAGVLKSEGSMKSVAGLVRLSDAGEGSSIATLGESAQQLRVQFAAAAGAVMVDVDIDTGLSRPLEGTQALQRLSVGEADDLILAFQDEPFVGGAQSGDTRSHLLYRRHFDFPTDGRVLDVGAVNRHAGARILEDSLTHNAANHLHASSLPAAQGFATVSGPLIISGKARGGRRDGRGIARRLHRKRAQQDAPPQLKCRAGA